MPPPISNDLLQMREQNIGRLFQRAARLYSERALVKLAGRGHDGLTLSHTTLISHLDLDGTQISVLAERAGVTKQAMGQVAQELEARGYLQRAPDLTDGRAVLLRFTERGREFLRDAHQVKLEMEAEFAQVLGEAGLAQLRQLLEVLTTN